MQLSKMAKLAALAVRRKEDLAVEALFRRQWWRSDVVIDGRG